jgi:hypothetical protein
VNTRTVNRVTADRGFRRRDRWSSWGSLPGLANLSGQVWQAPWRSRLVLYSTRCNHSLEYHLRTVRSCVMSLVGSDPRRALTVSCSRQSATYQSLFFRLPSIARFYGGCPSSNDGGTHFTLPQCPSDLQTNRRSSWRWRYDTLRHSLRSCPLGDPIGSTAAVNAIR